MFTLLVMRHAQADNSHLDGKTRPLTDQGRQEHLILSAQLKERELAPSLILASPLLRAQETAKILSETCDNAPIDTEPALGGEFDADLIMGRVHSLIESNPVICLVGHMPTLAEFVNALVGERCLPRGLPTSGTAVIRFEDRPAFASGELVEVVVP